MRQEVILFWAEGRPSSSCKKEHYKRSLPEDNALSYIFTVGLVCAHFPFFMKSKISRLHEPIPFGKEEEYYMNQLSHRPHNQVIFLVTYDVMSRLITINNSYAHKFAASEYPDKFGNEFLSWRVDGQGVKSVINYIILFIFQSKV